MGALVTVKEAADILGVSQQAIRQRIYRGTLQHEKDADGRVYVLLTEDNAALHGGIHGETHGGMPGVGGDLLVEELRDRLRYVEGQLEQEREANRENRRLLAAALERVPAVEAPSPPERGARSQEAHAQETAEPRKWWEFWWA